MSKQDEPPVPLDRLEAMRVAIIKHMYAADSWHEPLSEEMAREIEKALVLIKRHFERKRDKRKPSRAKGDNLRAAKVARFLITVLDVPTEDAVAAVFPQAGSVDRQSLAKNYRNLLPLIEDPYVATPDYDRQLLFDALARLRAMRPRAPRKAKR